MSKGAGEADEVVEEKTPCPYCGASVSESALECSECKSILPYCSASGKHMIAEEWMECKHCGFPALSSEIEDHVCAMCGGEGFIKVEHQDVKARLPGNQIPAVEETPKQEEPQTFIVRAMPA